MAILSVRGDYSRRYTLYVYTGLILSITLWLFRPMFQWLFSMWRVEYQDTFGYWVPLVSGWAIAVERRRIQTELPGVSRWGWAYFLPGMLLALFSRTPQQALTACLAFPFYVYGLCLLMLGKAKSRHLIFPIFFCLLLYPWDTVADSLIGFHLRLLSTWLAFWGLKMFGLAVSVSGTSIEAKDFLIDIAPACSGIATLKALLFAGGIGAYLFRGALKWKSLLWASTVPLAVILNMLRIISVGVIGHVFSRETAVSFHEVSGILIFGIGLLTVYGEALFLRRYVHAID